MTLTSFLSWVRGLVRTEMEREIDTEPAQFHIPVMGEVARELHLVAGVMRALGWEASDQIHACTINLDRGPALPGLLMVGGAHAICLDDGTVFSLDGTLGWSALYEKAEDSLRDLALIEMKKECSSDKWGSLPTKESFEVNWSKGTKIVASQISGRDRQAIGRIVSKIEAEKLRVDTVKALGSSSGFRL